MYSLWKVSSVEAANLFDKLSPFCGHPRPLAKFPTKETSLHEPPSDIAMPGDRHTSVLTGS
jgi:hypothetical protein